MGYNQFLSGVANDLVNELVKRAPVDTGNLQNSIQVNKVDESSGSIVISMAEHGVHVEYGTRPHVIKPKNAKALHWKNGTKDVFAKEVKHPGTQPQPFIRPAIHQELKRIIVKNWNRHRGT